MSKHGRVEDAGTMPPPIADPPTLKVSGPQYEQLVGALVDAYPDYADLRAMARFRLDVNLATVAGANASLDEVVFLLVQHQKARGHFLRLLEAARASRPGNAALALVAEQFDLAMAAPRDGALQRIVVESNSFLDVTRWRERLAAIEGRVCRIEVATNAGTTFGTGFLVGPDLVLTNYHVVEPAVCGERGEYTAGGQTATLKDIVLRFDYRQRVDGSIAAGTTAGVAGVVDASPPSPVDEQPLPKAGVPAADHLDYALLRVVTPAGARPLGESPIGESAERSAEKRGVIGLPAADWAFTADAPLFIVQHPDGAPMKLALETRAVIGANGNGTRVTYRTNTCGGSSGSPCFNQHLDLVALHHAGDPNYQPLYHPEFNEGIPIAAIRAQLAARGRSDGVQLV
jgi:hypothetical protein